MEFNPLSALGKFLILLGVVLIVAGILLALGGQLPLRIGRLPGDIYIKRDNFIFYFPITTAILLSVLISLLLYLLRSR